jgi:hypothetical protein
MKTRFNIVPLVLIIWLSNAALAQVSVDFDKTVDFNHYRTYAWLDADIRVGENPIYNSDLVNRNIKEHVEMEFAKRGMNLTATNPDLLVGYHTYTEKKVQPVSNPPMFYPGGFQYGWRYFPYGYGNWPYMWNNGFRSIHYTEGTLIIDVVDAKTKQLIWRGIAEGTVDNPKAIERRVQKGVHAIMKRYPAHFNEPPSGKAVARHG